MFEIVFGVCGGLPVWLLLFDCLVVTISRCGTFSFCFGGFWLCLGIGLI